MNEKDIQICTLLRKRDAKGMKCLFDVYYRPLVVWSDTFLNDISLSEDLVQDFFIKLWESKSCEKLLASTLKSYLYISVRNLALNMKIKVDPLRHACNLVNCEKPWEEYDDFEEEIIRKVEREIDKLPRRSREIIKCVYCKGMRYKEVAAELNISVATVNTLLVIALKKLRKATGKNDDILVYWLHVCFSRVKEVVL